MEGMTYEERAFVAENRVTKLEKRIVELEADNARLREALVWIGKQDSSIHFIKMRERALEAIASTTSWSIIPMYRITLDKG
jgi:hypothetical protein